MQQQDRNWWLVLEHWTAEEKNSRIIATHFLTLHFILIKTNIACTKDFNSSLRKCFLAESLSCFQKGMFILRLILCNEQRLELIMFFFFTIQFTLLQEIIAIYILALPRDPKIEAQLFKWCTNTGMASKSRWVTCKQPESSGFRLPSQQCSNADSHSALPAFGQLYPIYPAAVDWG